MGVRVGVRGRLHQRPRALLGLSQAGNAYDRARLSCWVSLRGFLNLSSLLGAPNAGQVRAWWGGERAWFLSCWKPKGGLGPYLGHQGRPPPRRGFQNLSQSASEHLQAVSKCLSSKAPSFGTGGSHSRPLWWLFGKNDSRQTAYSLKWNRPNWGQLQTGSDIWDWSGRR